MKKILFPLSIVGILTVSSCSFFDVKPTSTDKPSFIDSETTSETTSESKDTITTSNTSNSDTSTTSEHSENTSETSTTSETSSTSEGTSVTSETSTTSEASTTSETSTTSEDSTTSEVSSSSESSSSSSSSEEEKDVWYANIPTVRTVINHGSENYDYKDESNSIDIKDTFLYWADTNWNGSVVVASNHYAEDKTVYYSYSIQSGSCNWGFQSFYKNSNLVSGQRYTIEFDLYSLRGGTIGVNHTSKVITSGNNKISLSYEENSNQSSFMISFPTSLGDNEVNIKNIKWTLVSDTEEDDDTPVTEVTYPDGYNTLVFQDEFTGNKLDTSKWSYQIGNGDWGWGNGELQYYTNSNDTVKDGFLTIEARKETIGDFNYTSTRIRTKDKAKFTYGYIEARIALPEGTAMWPAFWMMPNNDAYGEWPRSGEIDIMEAMGRLPYVSSSALHYTVKGNDDHTYSTHEYNHSTKITRFHTYACKWTANSITFYVDGDINYVAYKNSWQTNSAPGNDVAPFDQDFYVILNLAVGGQFDDFKTPDDSSLPKQMKVDYVRWFQ